MKKRELTFADIRQHPFDRHVGDRVRRRRISWLNEKSGLRVFVCDFAGYWTAHDQGGIGLAQGDHLIDFGVGLAKDEHSIPRGFQSALCGLLIRSRLLFLALGNSAKTLDPRQFLVGQIEGRRRADQVRLRLDKVGTFNCVERLVLLNPGAKIHQGSDDRSLVSRENLNCQVFVKINVADRFLLGRKQVVFHRFDLDRVDLAGRQVQGRFGRVSLGFCT